MIIDLFRIKLISSTEIYQLYSSHKIAPTYIDPFNDTIWIFGKYSKRFSCFMQQIWLCSLSLLYNQEIYRYPIDIICGTTRTSVASIDNIIYILLNRNLWLQGGEHCWEVYKNSKKLKKFRRDIMFCLR